MAKKKKWENVPKPAELKDKLDGVSLGKDKDGYFVYTHRARCKSYSSPEKIPKSKIKFIESTGAAAEFLVALADELDQEGKPQLADEVDRDFEEFLKLLEEGKLDMFQQYSGEPRDPRGPYSNLGRETTIHGV